jgi:proteasome activator subunit 4
MDFVVNEFHSTDYNGESSFDALKALSLFRAIYEELDWKFSPWINDAVERCWPELCAEHDDVISFHRGL